MAKKLTFGLLYDLRNPAEWRKPWADFYAETLDFITWTESLGFEAAWVPEHHVDEAGYVPSPMTVLSAIAARTKTIKLGPAVALAPFHHPVRFAEDCAAVDLISRGRLEIVVSLGYRRRETDAYGIDFKSRASRMDEFIEIVRRLLAGEQLSYEGRHFNLKNAFIMPGPTRPDIPFLIGGFSEKALARVAKYGDGYSGLVEYHDLYRQKLREIGKDPADTRFYVQTLNVVVDHDPKKTMDEVAPYYHFINNAYGVWLNEDQYDSRINLADIPKTMSLEDFKASGLLQVLTPGQAIEYFKTMQTKAPVEHVMIAVPPGLPLSKYASYVELFAKEVIPAFR